MVRTEAERNQDHPRNQPVSLMSYLKIRMPGASPFRGMLGIVTIACNPQ
jgi:hypothetical protein